MAKQIEPWVLIFVIWFYYAVEGGIEPPRSS